MESNQDESEQSGVQSFTNIIESCEKTSEVIEWLKNVCQPEQQLINSFIQTFFDFMEKDISFSNQIIRSLQKLNEFIPELILPQLKKNTKFPQAIAKYITQTETKNLSKECYLLLADIFTTSNFASLIDKNFIIALLTALSLIENEEIFKSIIAIILSISSEYKMAEDNLVIKAIQEHSNARYFLEYLMHFINKGNENEKLQCLKILHDSHQLKIYDFLYTNDQKMLIDIVLQELDSNPEQNLTVDYLKCIGDAINSPNYKKDFYRREDILTIFSQLNLMKNQLVKDEIERILAEN